MNHVAWARDHWQLLGWLAGPGLLAGTGAIHLDLYLTGYRSIPTIGWLFLLQVIAAFGLALLVALTRSPLAALAAAGFSLSILGGYLLSLWIGLFNFKETRTTAGIVAGLIEVTAFALLTLVAVEPLVEHVSRSAHPRGPVADRVRRSGRPFRTATAATAVLATVLLGIALASAGGAEAPAVGGHAELVTTQVRGTTVLTNRKGFTLYWFALDGPSKSRCYGGCAAYWPPVIGVPTAGPGVVGRLGTTKRSDGTIQATYDSHPLYTYLGDSAPGQANGNGLDLNGGLWHEMAISRRL